LREAIQHMSADATARHVFTHTGWRDVGGERVFLVNGGAIGAPGVEVELEGPLARYDLPTEVANVSDIASGMGASLRLLDVAPYRVSFPLWSAMYLAPLSELLPVDFTLWLLGRTGRMKSTLAAVALGHYGVELGDRTKLPTSWEATANAL